jgi:hypothetical protein
VLRKKHQDEHYQAERGCAENRDSESKFALHVYKVDTRRWKRTIRPLP